MPKPASERACSGTGPYAPFEEIEAVVAGISLAGAVIDDDPELQLVEEIEAGEELGLAVETGSTALAERVDESLTSLEQNGTLQDLEAKWLGSADGTASPEPAASPWTRATRGPRVRRLRTPAREKMFP